MLNKKRFIKYYSAVGIQLLNAIVFFALLNLLLWGVFGILDELSGTPQARFESDRFESENTLQSYPGWEESELKILLDVGLFNIFDPYTQFRVGPIASKYVNVDTNGYRLVKDQGSWPPADDALNVFVFGGSTTFGLGLPDDQTIPSFLQTFLRKSLLSDVYVYNFGKLAHFSVQERISFEQLLLNKFRPNLVVFIDGLNDFIAHDGVPVWSHRLNTLVEQSNSERREVRLNWYLDTIDVLHHFPFYRVARSAKGALNSFVNDQSNVPIGHTVIATSDERGNFDLEASIADQVVERWIQNKDMTIRLTDSYDIESVFVIQPVPVHNYDINYHHAASGNMEYFGKVRRAVSGYQSFDRMRRSNGLGSNVLWLADVQKDRTENLYVDRSHYTAKFSEELASYISEHILEESLLTD